jgi:hypothetical protein
LRACARGAAETGDSSAPDGSQVVWGVRGSGETTEGAQNRRTPAGAAPAPVAREKSPPGAAGFVAETTTTLVSFAEGKPIKPKVDGKSIKPKE